MPENYQKTVNLKGGVKKTKKAEEIDHLYNNNEYENGSLKQIERPKFAAPKESAYRKAVLFILFVFVVFFAYWLIFQKGTDKTPAGQISDKPNWYAIKIITGDIYYGQVDDIKADPVAVKNVYYDYDQEREKSEAERGGLRLVKRGQETQGGDGSMNIIRAQVLYLEPLRDDSKVLQAIMEYEK